MKDMTWEKYLKIGEEYEEKLKEKKRVDKELAKLHEKRYDAHRKLFGF